MAAAARKTVTVLFCDLADSTPLGDSMDPEALRALYSRYYAVVSAAAGRHGGTVEKYIGDAVMAVFGIPVTHEDDPLRAVRAAVEMRASAQALGVTPRIGIETGEVVAGDPTPGHAFATGPAVVTAERLEKKAGGNGILIGATTLGLVRDAVEVEAVGELELKGKREPVPAWRLLRVAQDAPPLARRLDTPIVDRERELAELEAEIAAVESESRCRLVPLIGPAGVGKSRLVLELCSRVEDRVRIVTGRCPQYGEGATFRPIVEVLRQLGDVSPADETAQRVAAGLLADDPVPTEQAFWAVRKKLEAAAETQPLLVVIEDVEGAERTLLDLIDYLVGWSRERPILLCCLARSELLEVRAAWGVPGDDVRPLVLAPLDEADAYHMLELLTGGAHVDRATALQIVETAAGNPLFVEELLRMLFDDGVLAREGDRVVVRGELARLPVPRSVQAVLAARLDRLAPEERAAVQRAAVVGQEFWWSAMTALSNGAGPDLATHLQTLVRKQFVTPARSTISGEDAFRFDHPLIREAAYDSLPKGARAELHARAAEWLDERGAADEDVGRHLELAHRYAAELGSADAELARRAATRLGTAGRRAVLGDDMHAARGLLARAVALLGADEPARLELLLDYGIALRDTGAFDDARTVFEELIARGGERLRMHARLDLAYQLVYTDPEREIELVEEHAAAAAAVFAELGDDSGLAKAAQIAAIADFAKCRWAAVEERLGRALEYAQRGEHRRALPQILRGLAWGVLQGPRNAEDGIDRLSALLVAASGYPSVEAVIGIAIATLRAMRCEIASAREVQQRSVEVLSELGMFYLLATSRYGSGMIELLAGDPVAAEREFRAGIDALEALGDKAVLPTLRGLLAQALVEQGQIEQALEATRAAEGIAVPTDVMTHALWRTQRSRVRSAQRSWPEAEALARSAIAYADETDDPNLRASAREALADALAGTGRRDDTAAAVHEALALYEAKGNAVAAARLSERLLSVAPAERGP